MGQVGNHCRISTRNKDPRSFWEVGTSFEAPGEDLSNRMTIQAVISTMALRANRFAQPPLLTFAAEIPTLRT